MSRIINRREAAQIDLYNHATYISKDNLPAAERFLEAAERAFERLAEMPGIGTLREYRNPALLGMRMWPIPEFTNYLIFYQATDAIKPPRMSLASCVCFMGRKISTKFFLLSKIR